MQHVTFALFRKPREARDALRELDDTFARDERVRVSVGSSETPASDLEMYETHAGSALLRGALFGLVSGLVVGLLAFVVGLRWFHFDASTGLFTPVAGAILGGLAGVLFGSINPNPSLNALRRMAKTGGLIITVESEDERTTHKAEEILRDHHGYLKLATS